LIIKISPYPVIIELQIVLIGFCLGLIFLVCFSIGFSIGFFSWVVFSGYEVEQWDEDNYVVEIMILWLQM